MAALVQAKSQEIGSSTSLTITPTAAVTAGNLLAVGVGVFGEATASITISDTLGSTWTKVLSTWQPDRDSGIFLNWFYTVLASSGTNGVKTQGPSNGFWGNTVAELSGLGTPTQDGSSGAAGSETNPQNGATFTAVAGDLLLAFLADEGNSETISAGAGWTKAASASTGILNNGLIYVLSAAAGSTHGIWGTGQVGAAMGNIYLALTPGGGAPADPYPAYDQINTIATNAIFKM